MRLLSRLRRLLTPAQGKLVEAAANVTVPGSAGLSLDVGIPYPIPKTNSMPA